MLEGNKQSSWLHATLMHLFCACWVRFGSQNNQVNITFVLATP